MALLPLLLTLVEGPGNSFDGFRDNSRGDGVVSCDVNGSGGLLASLEVLG